MKSLEFLITGLSPLNPVCRLINRIVDEEARIQDRASPELARIRRDVQSEMRHLHRAIARLMNKAKSEDWLHEENPTIREGRLVLPLRTEYKRKVHGIIHGQSATGATTFIEPMEAVEINNRLKELEQEEKEEVIKILQQISGEIRPYFTELERNIVILIELDFIRACAKFSEKFKCSPPIISEQDRKIVLINSKHPLLSLVKKVVPLNLSLPDGISSMIITGPNAGGKTVAMKTVGLLSVMAMSGLHIPADEGSHIPFFDIFLVDIGDLQSIENDLSTFSSHVSNLKAFLDKATDQSLVLIDELGTGTEPVEGSALGQAVLERLVEKRAFTIVTTHHNALKAFADKSPNVVNAAMEFSTDTLSPTYRLRLGYPGSSYALEISKRLGLSDKVIDRARKIMGGDTVKLENLLLEAEKLKTKLEE
ncbi:MAG: endonuclease MutS2, partial [Candidatus Marinimicrobia bacterium]|nr:endonuclease MutS2 [Candidatus Neomarinimicrobiota bacterium]